MSFDLDVTVGVICINFRLLNGLERVAEELCVWFFLIMGWYRRGALDHVRILASRFMPQNSNFRHSLRSCQSWFLVSGSKGASFNGFSSWCSISQRLGTRGVVGAKRTHLILLSKTMERRIGENEFEKTKATFKGKMLPPLHPESVRVTMIAKEIIDALQRGLRKNLVLNDLGSASEQTMLVEGGDGRETFSAFVGSVEKVGRSWHEEDKILDDKQTPKNAQERGSPTGPSHLDGLNWEILVVNEPVVNAFCLPGGKIVLFSGLFEHFKSDAEIATIIAHEVGHAVGRHSAEGITKNLCFGVLQLMLYQLVIPDIVNILSSLFLHLPFTRRMETEADYIGLLLMASAGYDPRVAPRVYEKLGQIAGDSTLMDYLSTHPSGIQRAELLAQAKIMEEAFNIYRDVRKGHKVVAFL
ncbi:unnamed protein product [Sphenostylis stenocarpa]|uniref:Peptidase M48 domain-containing protein n=1 Tax=Sphenostylis stenocarpa TaxID=92480 RepID=A0AA86W5H7_9FABA|nr:unnamed protein product [Sphenostylis stenocarpa]